MADIVLDPGLAALLASAGPPATWNTRFVYMNGDPGNALGFNAINLDDMWFCFGTQSPCPSSYGPGGINARPSIADNDTSVPGGQLYQNGINRLSGNGKITSDPVVAATFGTVCVEN